MFGRKETFHKFLSVEVCNQQSKIYRHQLVSLHPVFAHHEKQNPELWRCFVGKMCYPRTLTGKITSGFFFLVSNKQGRTNLESPDVQEMATNIENRNYLAVGYPPGVAGQISFVEKKKFLCQPQETP